MSTALRAFEQFIIEAKPPLFSSKPCMQGDLKANEMSDLNAQTSIESLLRASRRGVSQTGPVFRRASQSGTLDGTSR